MAIISDRLSKTHMDLYMLAFSHCSVKQGKRNVSLRSLRRAVRKSLLRIRSVSSFFESVRCQGMDLTYSVSMPWASRKSRRLHSLDAAGSLLSEIRSLAS